MWCIVMFDLPVKTAAERSEANRFRTFLINKGFSMLQLSVYIKYWPTGGVDMATIKSIKGSLPHGGSVRILPITDKQWSISYRFESHIEENTEDAPEQLTIF